MKKKTDELSRRQMLAAMAVSSLGSVAKESVIARPKTAYHFSNSPNSKLVTISAKPAAIAIDTSKTTVGVMKIETCMRERIMKNTRSLMVIGALTVAMLCTLAVYSGCQTNKQSANQQTSSKPKGPGKKFSQVVLKVDYVVPTVGISEYTLITDDLEGQRKDAEAIMRRKKDMPLAVQRHDAALFNSWCARDFVSRGEHEFLGSREEYIQDHVNATWTVLDARYENLVLQFFGETALLTYRNIVSEKDEKGVPTKWLYTWADVWVKEDGEWKVAAIYVIDSKKA